MKKVYIIFFTHFFYRFTKEKQDIQEFKDQKEKAAKQKLSQLVAYYGKDKDKDHTYGWADCLTIHLEIRSE